MKQNEKIVTVKVNEEIRVEGVYFCVRKDDVGVDLFNVKEEAITRGKQVAKQAMGHLYVDDVLTEDFTCLKRKDLSKLEGK